MVILSFLGCLVEFESDSQTVWTCICTVKPRSVLPIFIQYNCSGWRASILGRFIRFLAGPARGLVMYSPGSTVPLGRRYPRRGLHWAGIVSGVCFDFGHSFTLKLCAVHGCILTKSSVCMVSLKSLKFHLVIFFLATPLHPPHQGFARP